MAGSSGRGDFTIIPFPSPLAAATTVVVRWATTPGTPSPDSPMNMSPKSKTGVPVRPLMVPDKKIPTKISYFLPILVDYRLYFILPLKAIVIYSRRTKMV